MIVVRRPSSPEYCYMRILSESASAAVRAIDCDEIAMPERKRRVAASAGDSQLKRSNFWDAHGARDDP